MFRIPNFYQFETTFDDAVKVMKNYGAGDLLEGMETLCAIWDEHCIGKLGFDDDDEFYEEYETEVNAYNVVFKNMGALFESA